MSEKRTPISIYRSPRAAVILGSYSRGSGYGSVSRTVEEIILAFDDIYKNMGSMHQLINAAPANPMTQQERAAMSLIAAISVLQTLSNIISRLSRDEMQLEE
jgi:hypothetical protein